MTVPLTVVWFRQDLRLDDNPALQAAIARGNPIVPMYILDTQHAGHCSLGSASKVWLHHSLDALNKSLNNHLTLLQGDPIKLLDELVNQHSIDAVYWNRCYSPWEIERDKKIKRLLANQKITVKSFGANLLFEPMTVLKDDGTPYKVFTPFYKNGCLKRSPPPRPAVKTTQSLTLKQLPTATLKDLDLLPINPWHKPLMNHWQPGEKGASKQLKLFLKQGLHHYKTGRDFPTEQAVSKLSPHLHFGEISPFRLWHIIQQEGVKQQIEDQSEHFLRELIWREFSYYLLFHFPDLPTKNFQSKFDHFPWKKNKSLLQAWQQGKTGYPIIDAGMRELWQTGSMHNRVRMIVASFLVKNCLIHWREGAAWFWDTLVDADLANNSASWQWVAGSGADAAPYFRIFNPVTQSQKFDPEGHYIKQFVPELSSLPAKYIHAPFDAPDLIIKDSNILLGEDYPKPSIDLKTSRQISLDAYSSIKNTT